MTTVMKHENEHVVDLLPAYINQTLAPEQYERVHAHLLCCEQCSEELVLWQGIADATLAWTIATSPTVQPSLQLLEHVWTQAGGAQLQTVGNGLGVRRKIRLLWQLVQVQVQLLPRSCWIVLPLAIAFGFTMLAMFSGGTYLSALLGFIAPLISAASVGFIHNAENTTSLEIALATPTSPRLVLTCRIGLICAYNLILALLVTLGLALFNGANFSLLVSLWMGPMLLLTGVSLLISLTISTLSGVGSAFVLWCLRFAHALLPTRESPVSSALATLNSIWQTSPGVLIGALLLFMLAIYVMPRQMRRTL